MSFQHTLSHNVVSSTRRHELFIVIQLHFKLEFIVIPSKAAMIKNNIFGTAELGIYL
jgi:hypothetical protein